MLLDRANRIKQAENGDMTKAAALHDEAAAHLAFVIGPEDEGIQGLKREAARLRAAATRARRGESGGAGKREAGKRGKSARER